MQVAIILIVVSLLCPAAWCASARDLIGTWEGEPKCTFPDSACHDERARYRIVADQKNPGKFNLLGYKVVNGDAVFMGTLECEYHGSQSTLTCTGHTARQDDWEFQVSGDTMTGTLKLGAEKALYRRITLRKK